MTIDERLQGLRHEAMAAGDEAMAELCELAIQALPGSAVRDIAIRALRDAAAQQDDGHALRELDEALADEAAEG